MRLMSHHDPLHMASAPPAGQKIASEESDADPKQTAEPRTTSLLEDGGSAATTYDDFGHAHSGAIADESTRVQLGEETSRVDKAPIAPDKTAIVAEPLTRTPL